ncbi:2,3-bisphosphoglycerate-dependent phosphoglycerate mutase [Methylobacterium sp. J-092]|uniref:2,3-bisphosphoglycerate-dependent phosphoglycerate mutase n=1 Tax=Methylobacterium sp. J-092 TaxID=2836667 RepID=UPI001FB8FD9D|nr:2,3-bisphosphoglycerate-dependent phosphoglycerate mutase [Methylobacterium sp. J-092]MCJ2006947.1 2,3-bisphosphoglycerate-dependent phosphoglycerate mutase [Methylobacterium sp. J-092]
MDRLLVLARHGQSEWNLKNLFTGWRNPDLTERGVDEAHKAGRWLKSEGYGFDVAFTSNLGRAQRTCKLMLGEMGLSEIETIRSEALNERDYGDLSGLNKEDAKARWGAEQVHQWRRSYDIPPPGGESLKDTAARVLPYYIETILPRVMAGDRVLVAAHGNSLRALVMVLDRLNTTTIAGLEIATGVPLVYRLKGDTTVASKTVLERDIDDA